MPRGDWDDISVAQRKALRAMVGMPKGGGTTDQLREEAGISIPTLNALARYGLVRCNICPIIRGCMVVITDSGRESV